ncbi:Cof-type HAD-IIB family hydrolase [Vibrio sp. LaRot3]|uniref:Cof-type HAD-IIB family hydrolase n=1 Tax=Vibrio sp. LaRot3 TaxID=2998829 RepID=UPI0022CDC9D0|nr:Cof-type HAD-IIB family hydrolase [Vibrio sp. LaRot3]MDA0150179.1 Cof-type HAD-IIB family hydrolase [Vibrio sp. LaRot3]
MPASNIKFIASDMDGTLLNESSQLDPEFYDIYRQLTDKGIIFAAASGRQYASLQTTFAPIKDEMMFVAENGTLVMHKGQELYSCPLDYPTIVEVIKSVRNIDGAYTVLCGKKSAYIETQDPTAIAELSKYYHECQYVDDLLTVEDEFIKVAICHFDSTEKHVYPTMNEKFGHSHQVVVSAKIWLDIMNAEASKGAAIEHLQKTLGFSHEQTMSFGDYFNDVEMLKASYHSYAVENAHPEVKQYAKFSAPSNNDSGVLKVIKETVL